MLKPRKVKSLPIQQTSKTKPTNILIIPLDCLIGIYLFLPPCDLSVLIEIGNTCKEFLYSIKTLLHSDSKFYKKIKLDFSLLSIKETEIIRNIKEKNTILNIKDEIKIIQQELLDYLLYVRNIAIPQEYSEESIYTILEKFSEKKYGYLNGLDIHESHIQNFDKFTKFFENLKKLNINFCQQIKDETLEYFKNILILDLSGCKNITSKGLKHLVSVYDLNLSHCNNITSEGLEYLTSVRKLNLNFCSQIKNLDKLNSKNLKVLKLIGCEKLSKINWYDFKRDQCPNLKILIKPDGQKIDFVQEEKIKMEEKIKKIKLKQTIEDYFPNEEEYQEELKSLLFYNNKYKFSQKNYLGSGEMQI